ncbi:CHAT domain-containing protein [candidate division KSB1 bacterium]|nr:CHAT domain-containing protein [candidate division KSB1 bacterium]
MMERFYQVAEPTVQKPPGYDISTLKTFVENHPNFVRAYQMLVEHWLATGEYNEAKSFFQAKNNRLNLSYCDWMKARILSDQDSLEAAYKSFSRALENEDIPSLELISDFIDFCHQRRDKSCKTITDQNQNLPGPILDFAKALKKFKHQEYEAALAILSRLDSEFQTHLKIILTKIQLLHQLSRYEESENLCQDGIKLSQAQRDKRFEALFSILYGRVQIEKNNAADARKYYELATKIAKNISDRFVLARAQGYMAGLEFRQGNYGDAFELFVKAQKQASDIGAREDEARWILGKAKALNQLGELNEAIEAFDECQDYSLLLNNDELLFKVKLEKGIFFSKINVNNLANIELQYAQSLAQKKNLMNQLSRVRARLAFIMFDEQHYNQARKTFLEMLETDSASLRPIDRVFYRFMIGETYFFEKRYELAKNEYEKAYELAHKWAQQGFYPDYLENYKAYAQQRIGNIKTEQGNASEAIKIYNEELIKEAAKKDVNLNIDLNYDLGNAFDALDNFEIATDFYAKASNLLEKNRAALEIEHFRIGYLSQGIRIYQALINTYFKRFQATKDSTDLEKLFCYLEMSRLRTLKDWSVDENRLSEQYQAYLDACSDLQTIQRQIRYNPILMDSLLSRYETARYNLLSKKLEIIEQPTDSTKDIPSLKDLSGQISKSELSLLLYHISEKTSFVLAASDTNIQIVPLQTKADSLQAAVRALLSPFHDLSKDRIEEVSFRADIAYQLHKDLLKPVEDRVSLKKRIVIIPDLELTGLPFEMLLARSPNLSEYLPTDQPEYAEDFLLHRYSFVYSPSTWLLTSHQPKPQNKPETLVLANPIDETSSASLNDLLAARAGWRSDILWYADTEADSIKTIHPEAHIFKRRRATKAVLKQESSKHQILHFATHAFVDTVFDDFSGLVLATSADSMDDGLCMGYEISNLDLNCDLVTLSGCETGRGRIVAGEGVLGLPRKFLGAGAKSVLMTLWKVDDKFTSELMPRFYDNYLNHGLSKASALREAKRTVTNRPNESGVYYQHPFFWASFTLYGQPGMAKENTNSLPLYGLAAVVAGIIALSGLYFFRRTKS